MKWVIIILALCCFCGCYRPEVIGPGDYVVIDLGGIDRCEFIVEQVTDNKLIGVGIEVDRAKVRDLYVDWLESHSNVVQPIAALIGFAAGYLIAAALL